MRISDWSSDVCSSDLMDYYNAMIAEKENSTVEITRLENGKTRTISGTGEARVENVALLNSKGEQAGMVGVGERVSLQIRVRVHKDIETLVLGYSIKDRLGQVMYGTNTWLTTQVVNRPKAGAKSIDSIVFPANLSEGRYSVTQALVARDNLLTAHYERKE